MAYERVKPTYIHSYAISIPDSVTSNCRMITEYQLQKYRRKRPVSCFELLSLYLAEEAEENHENPRDIVSLGGGLRTGPSERERGGLTARPCKNERRNQKDRFILRKHGNSLICKRYISSFQLSNTDKRSKSVACIFAQILSQCVVLVSDSFE